MNDPEISLAGSVDPVTGDHFFPQRALSVDGTLRALEPVPLPTSGLLSVFVEMGEAAYGYVDFDNGVRLMSALGPGPHEIGATYVLAGSDERRFDRA